MAQEALEKLTPSGDAHKKVKQMILDRLETSERAMSQFYDRWRAAEIRAQAYIDLEDYEKVLKAANDQGQPPKITSLVVPYTFATLGVINTYLLHTFTGRKPYFQVGAAKEESIQPAQLMELVLQYNADRTRIVRRLGQYFYDGPLYGLAVGRTCWEEEWQFRSEKRPAPYQAIELPSPDEMMSVRTNRRVYEGTNVYNIDPFLFFPDPRVPMSEVNRRGEFVFWRSFVGRHELKKAEAQGKLMWVGDIPDITPPALSGGESTGASNRGLISRGQAHPGEAGFENATGNIKSYVQVDQGTIEIIPSEWGLGEGDQPQKWVFSLANKSVVIQAEPFDYDHSMHPVFVTEPYTMGYAFGQPGIVDYIGPIQDAISWYWNSHVYNVRYALNNRGIYNPMMIDGEELNKNEPGQWIAMKPTASGTLPSQAVMQLPVIDITQGHMDDMQALMRIGDTITAVTDNLRGVQQAGGRKTATEVRASGEAAASRLAALATAYSAQGLVDLTEQMALNAMQFMSEEMYINIVGMEGAETPLVPRTVIPGDIVGDFHYPIHDGTLPLDKVAMLDVWEKIFATVTSDPLLGTAYDRQAILEYMASLSGAKNLDRFRMKAMPDQQVMDQAQAGNLVPVPEFTSGPAQRAQGGESSGY